MKTLEERILSRPVFYTKYCLSEVNELKDSSRRQICKRLMKNKMYRLAIKIKGVEAKYYGLENIKYWFNDTYYLGLSKIDECFYHTIISRLIYRRYYLDEIDWKLNSGTGTIEPTEVIHHQTFETYPEYCLAYENPHCSIQLISKNPGKKYENLNIALDVIIKYADTVVYNFS